MVHRILSARTLCSLSLSAPAPRYRAKRPAPIQIMTAAQIAEDTRWRNRVEYLRRFVKGNTVLVYTIPIR